MKRTRNRRMRRNKTRRNRQKRLRRGGQAKLSDGNTEFASKYIRDPKNKDLFYIEQPGGTIPIARYKMVNGHFEKN